LEVIGDKSASSFTIDMNKLFEDFVANLLIGKLGERNILLQQTEYPEVKGNKLKVRLDIEIFRNGIPLIILDTKYKDGARLGKIRCLNTIITKNFSLYPNTNYFFQTIVIVHVI
jgi:5-methylcytosine-specific restriction endonuclease McrBC regulatory subunit McrC